MFGLKNILVVVISVNLIGCLNPIPRFVSTENSHADPLRIGQTVEGIASYYADEFHGRLTANGEVYDMNGLSAAHKYLPFGSIVRVTNRDNQKSVTLRINDRGPFVGDREIDLSLEAAKELGFVEAGTCPVTIEVLGLGSNPN